MGGGGGGSPGGGKLEFGDIGFLMPAQSLATTCKITRFCFRPPTMFSTRAWRYTTWQDGRHMKNTVGQDGRAGLRTLRLLGGDAHSPSPSNVTISRISLWRGCWDPFSLWLQDQSRILFMVLKLTNSASRQVHVSPRPFGFVALDALGP